MKRRIGRIGRAAVLLAAVAILFFYPFVAPPAHRIDQAHFDMVKGGMTEAEVDGIFGVPAGDYDWAVANPQHLWLDIDYFSTGRSWTIASPPRQFILLHFDDVTWISGTNLGHFKTWTSRHGSFQIGFNTDGRVSFTQGLGATTIEPPWTRWWRQWTAK
jgi:hypothetical protein